MPRGQKSKLRSREKRRQAREEPNSLKDVLAIIVEKEEASSFSGMQFKEIPEKSSDAGATSSMPAAAASASAASADVSCTTTDEDIKSQVEEKPSTSQVTTQYLLAGFLDQMDQRVLMLVNYLLYKYQMKEPITKADILRNVIKTHKNRFPEILRLAAEHLELVFGLDLKEVDPNRNIYVLINKLELGHDARVNDNRGIPKTGLLMTILGVIFTKGNCATEEQVWEVLNMMGIQEGRKHFLYGEPKKLITKDLVKEKYLEYRQVANSDPPRYEFLWGPRAFAETSKMKVLEFLAKIHNTTPSAFPLWYEEAVKDEEERSRARIAAKASARSKVASSSSSRPK